MSGIISVIIWIVIMAAVSGVLKGKSNGSGTKDRNPYNKNGAAVPPQNTWNNGNAMPQSRAAQPDYSAGTVPENHRHGAVKGTHQTPPAYMATEKQANMATTDDLRQKAVLDEADHLQDKRQEEMRSRWETGGLPSAQRLYEGDSVPQGMRVIKCSYCGAENLVPQGSRQKYTCYFCREEL